MEKSWMFCAVFLEKERKKSILGGGEREKTHGKSDFGDFYILYYYFLSFYHFYL
jgi:hypothetical protein